MAESKSAAMFGSSRPSKGRVLVVEDEPHVRNAVRLILENAGYDVLEAPDEEKAIEAINTGENPLLIDTVAIDIDIKSGMETVAYFKKHYPRVPLVVLTGLPDLPMGNTKRIQIVILGGGKAGLALLDLLRHVPEVEIVGITDKDPAAPALRRARELGIPVVDDTLSLIAREGTHLIMDVTGDPGMERVLAQHKSSGAEALGGAASKLLWTLVQHESRLQKQLFQCEGLAGLVKEGIIDYLVKPVAQQRLLGAVTAAMERRRELTRL